MQTRSSIAIVGWFGLCFWFFFANINPAYPSEEELLSLQTSADNSCESLRKFPSVPNMEERNATGDFPLVIRLAKVDLHRVKTWKHLKYQ